jgi:hypothetical protein
MNQLELQKHLQLEQARLWATIYAQNEARKNDSLSCQLVADEAAEAFGQRFEPIQTFAVSFAGGGDGGDEGGVEGISLAELFD